LALVKSGIKAGYIDIGKFVAAKEAGTPQGSVLSPLLCNVLMHKLDIYMETLKEDYYKGTKRAVNVDYKQTEYWINKALKEGDLVSFRQIRAQRRSLPSINLMDPNFRRLWYVRYADDFMVGIVGPR